MQKLFPVLGSKSNFSASVGSSSAVLIFLRGLSLALSHDATQKANVYRRMPSILALPLRHGSSPGQTVCGDKAFRCSSCLPWACLPGRGKGCWVLQSCLHTHQVFIWLKQATRRASGPNELYQDDASPSAKTALSHGQTIACRKRSVSSCTLAASKHSRSHPRNERMSKVLQT